jgi:hypothetical protein
MDQRRYGVQRKRRLSRAYQRLVCLSPCCTYIFHRNDASANDCLGTRGVSSSFPWAAVWQREDRHR